jgi:hypothetical protein
LSKLLKVDARRSDDYRMRSRSYARRRLRAAWWKFLRDNPTIVAVLLGCVVALVALDFVLEPSPLIRGLLIGVTVTTLVGVVILIFLVCTGSIYTLAGAWGESLTRDEIKTAIKRGYVWGSVSNIELDGFDIDHLLVCPSGVIAIETKHHTTQPTSSRKTADLRQARDAARKAGLVLRSKNIDMPYEVRAVLVVWGRAAMQDLPGGGREIDGVRVVAGTDLLKWLADQNHGRVAQDHAEEVLTRLTAFRDTLEVRKPVLA